MSDLSTITPPPPPTPPPAFPPPSPAETESPQLSTTNKLMAVLAGVGLGLAAIMTILWIGERGDDDAATPEPPPAVEADDDRVAALEAELAASESAREAAVAETGSLQEQLDAALAEVAAADTAIADLTAENEQLRTDLAAAEARIAELEAELATPTPETPTAFDPSTVPEFSRWIGELLSSRTGSSRLGAEAATCYGGEVVSLIGLDALGAGQNNAADSESRQVVIDAMVSAAATCGIDLGLIFG